MNKTSMEMLIVDEDYDLRFIAETRQELRVLVQDYLDAGNLDWLVPMLSGEVEDIEVGWSLDMRTLFIDYTIDGEAHEVNFDCVIHSFDAITK